MDLVTAIKLIVALAIALEIRPEDLAEIFADTKETQEYWDKLVALAT